MRTRVTILMLAAGSVALLLATTRAADTPDVTAAPAPAVADTVSPDMPTIEVHLPRDERAELYRAVLELTDRVAELEHRVIRLEAELYVRQSELPAR